MQHRHGAQNRPSTHQRNAKLWSQSYGRTGITEEKSLSPLLTVHLICQFGFTALVELLSNLESLTNRNPLVSTLHRGCKTSVEIVSSSYQALPYNYSSLAD